MLAQNTKINKVRHKKWHTTGVCTKDFDLNAQSNRIPNQMNISRLYAVVTPDEGDCVSSHFHLFCCSKETLEPFFQCGMPHKKWVIISLLMFLSLAAKRKFSNLSSIAARSLRKQMIMSFHIFLSLAAQSRLSKFSSNVACPRMMWRIIAFSGKYFSQSLFSHLVCQLLDMLVCAVIIGFNIARECQIYRTPILRHLLPTFHLSFF